LVAEVVREMTVKAGQKCTAIRRVLAPQPVATALTDAIVARLAGVKVGNPRNEAVRMGPLVNKAQQKVAADGIAALKREARVAYEGGGTFVDADPAKGAFTAPTLLVANDPGAGRAVHDVEVFGPVSTVLPYRDAADAFALARRGQGSLVASVFSGDPEFLSTAALELAESHGRVLALDAATAKSSTGHGIVMPMCKHGGPGRAGGGEELGGLNALWFYHQRSALQGPAERLKAIADSSAATS
jgi:3,4-dehydroadipyl-CoA semialdehyde dehydrogenase